MNRFVAFASASLFATLTASAAAEPCPMFSPTPTFLQANTDALRDGQGVIVIAGYRANTSGARVVATSDVSQQPTWQFKQRKGNGKAVKVATTMEVLAPGLTRYLPTDGSGTLEVSVDGISHAITIPRATAKRPVPQLEAPTVTQLLMTEARSRQGSNYMLNAVLKTERPDDVVAVIIYGIDAKGVATPRSFATNLGKSLSPLVHINGPHTCEPAIPGTIDSKHGDTLALAWVDKLGRVSARSAPVKVVAAPVATPKP